MNRRRFLQAAAISSGLLAGCNEQAPTESGTDTAVTTTPSPTPETALGPVGRSFDAGAVYRFMSEADRWERCIDGEPAVGPYDSPPADDVVSQHADQLMTHGIGRVIFPVERARAAQAALEVASPSTGAGLQVEFSLDPIRLLRREQSLSEALAVVREAIGQIDGYASIDGRPVIGLVNLPEWRDGIRLHSTLTDAFDTPTAFLSNVREGLRLQDGSDPYLVGDLIRFGPSQRPRLPETYLNFAAQFDAVSSQIWRSERDATWDRAYQRTLDRYLAGRAFADEHDIDFEPTVYPGWNRRANACWDEASLIPRDPTNLLSLLRAAVLFSTTDRIRVESFNDWERGTQIEPGTFEETDYGTAYLETINRVQSTTTDRSLFGRAEYHVGPDGEDGNPGTADAPLATIKQALFRARPGTTIHLKPGEYDERVVTQRAGEPDAPITITGPREAIMKRRLLIRHSHVHLRGLTFDGLHDPDNPDDIDSYVYGGVVVNPFDLDQPAPFQFPGYVRDIVVKPDGIGNTRGAMINTFFAHDVEIGEFEVIGPAGVNHLLGEREGHNGEVVYIGTPPDKFGGHGTTIEGADVDESSGYHVHHIDNSAGHPHAELVDVKAGASDITIEYCTDAGGAASYLLPDAKEKGLTTNETAMQLGGNQITLRWCRVEGSQGQAVEVGSYPAVNPERWEEQRGFELPEQATEWGRNNSIYGNRLVDNGGLAIQYPTVDGEIPEGYGPDAQAVVCGNEYNGETHGDPDKQCGENVPAGNGIGHLGGESPWA